MPRYAVVDPNNLPTRVITFLCDTDECFAEGVWFCQGGVIACDQHKPKNGVQR